MDPPDRDPDSNILKLPRYPIRSIPTRKHCLTHTMLGREMANPDTKRDWISTHWSFLFFVHKPTQWS